MPAATTIDESLLDLFRSEAAAQLAALDAALAALGGGAKKTGEARQAVHAFLGAARLVGLEWPVPLAQMMEQLLATAQEQKRPPAAGTVAALRRAADWLREFSQCSAAELANPAAARVANRDACLQELIIFASVENPVTEPKKSGRVARQPINQTAEATPALPQPDNSPASRLDFSLLDMYRVEAETQLAALAQGVVELEGDLANPKKIEPIMRAAHSLKGAARIIGLDLAATLAHTMEDALVAVQQGRRALDAGGIDALLRAGDWLAQFSKLPQEQLAAPPLEQRAGQAKCLAEIHAVLAGESEKIMPVASAPTSSPPDAKPEFSSPQPDPAPGTPADAVVRISAASLSRMMGLAAETLVESRRLEPFRARLLKLKNDQLQMVSKLEAAAQEGGEGARNLDALRASAQATLEGLRAQLEHFDNASRRSTVVSGRLYQEVIASRLRPFADGTQALPRLVRDTARALGKQARLEIEGRETPVDRDILEKLEAPLSHLLRNACDHGLELPADRVAAGKPAAGVIRLEARHRAGMLVVQISDDGRGIALPRLRQKIVEQGRASAAMAAEMSEDEVLQFLFLPGFSTAETVTEISGRGVGLDVVQALAQEVGGTVRIYTTAGRGTTFTLQLPVTRSVVSALVAEVDGEAYAFPLTKLHRALRVPRASVVGGQVAVDGATATLVTAEAALGLPGKEKTLKEEIALVIFGEGAKLYALAVDRILGEMELVVRPLDARLGKVPGISAAAIGEDGAPILIVDVDDLLRGLEKVASSAASIPDGSPPARARKRILIVDDSATIRATEKQILERAGFAVELATDGADGWNAVRLGRFDLVVSDVDMPRLNGLELVARIRADARLQRLPVVIVSYKDRAEDLAAGRAAGADAYLAKSSIQDETFLRAVRQLLEIGA